jgi:cation diffusion facilitator CzcD-associated flavoprotein CzcO
VLSRIGDYPDDTTLDADIAIVGAGIAGLTLARALRGRDCIATVVKMLYINAS